MNPKIDSECAEPLPIGEHFPVLETRTVGGGTLRIPDQLAGRMAVLIFYRGHW